jgi:phage shock protein C
MNTQSHPTTKQLVRYRDDRMVAGVCSGLAAYLGLDVTVVRLLTVLGALFSFGTIALAYVVAWVLMPEV